jgi:hypothetical protein
MIGVMSGEGILDDPAIYFGHYQERANLMKQLSKCKQSEERRQLERDLDRLPVGEPVVRAKPSRLELALEYLDLATAYPVKQR